MNNFFTYSVLQYKHSLALGEILNVGILFYFPQENELEFVEGGAHRVKAIYPDFDNSLFNGFQKSILNNIKNRVELFKESPNLTDFSKYIHKYILAQDAAGFVFGESVAVRNVFGSKEKAIDEYSKLLLPGINIEKPTVTRHNESFIIKQFNGYLLGKDKTISEKILRNETIKLKSTTVKFDYVLNNNYIKPLSFDLTDIPAIQNKSAIIHSQLIQLNEFAKSKKARFDLLIAKPQDLNLEREYNNALDLIESAPTKKKIVTQDNWEKYFKNAVSQLVKS